MRTVMKNILGRTGRGGFTAIELTAVASIIAILALILIPIVRTRLESTRQTATLDDMRSIETAEVLANADTARYYPLQYLDNPSPDITAFNKPTATAVERAAAMRVVPNGSWNQPFNALEQANQNQIGSIGALWKGPYITYNNTKYVDINTYASGYPAFRTVNISTGIQNPTNTNAGPMVIYTDTPAPTVDPFNDDVTNQERYPIDPWGGPYLYFGPGRFGTLAGGGAFDNNRDLTVNSIQIPETNFGTSAVYSMGPDGRPGQNGPFSAVYYYREAGYLGTGDDFVRIF